MLQFGFRSVFDRFPSSVRVQISLSHFGCLFEYEFRLFGSGFRSHVSFAEYNEKVFHCELNVGQYICVFNKLMSIGICGNEFHIKEAVKSFKNTYAFYKYGVLSTLVIKLIRVQSSLLVILGN